MITLNLSSDYIQRVKRYYDDLLAGRFLESKSDYWMEHSAAAKIQFHAESIIISGASGFYIPPEVGTTGYWASRDSLRRQIRRWYKSFVLYCDRRLGLSAPHSLNTLITFDMAFDYVIQGHRAVDYDNNPHCFDTSQLSPVAKTSKELKKTWFLKDKYLADDHIFLTAYYHAIYGHFADFSINRYLEIGAGNGNLASFFKHYNKSKIVIIDIPETILYSSCYLKSIFPGATVLLPNEVSAPIELQEIDGNDFIFLVPSQAMLLPGKAFDLVVNTASMQEMTHKQIEKYFDMVQNLCRNGGLWCNANRVEKIPTRQERPVRAFSFPYKTNEVLIDQVDRFQRLVNTDGVVVHVERVCT